MRRPTIELLLIGLLITAPAGATKPHPMPHPTPHHQPHPTPPHKPHPTPHHNHHTPPDISRFCVTELDADSGLDYHQTVDVNRRGQVLGWGYLDGRVEVFLWDQKHGYDFIDELAHEEEIPARAAAGFNDRGQIVGTKNMDPEGEMLRAVIWKRGKGLQILEPAPGDEHSVGLAINKHGEVMGNSGAYPNEAGLGIRSAFWDRHGHVTVIPHFPDSTSSTPYAMNNAGQVVGGTDAPNEVRGFIWDRQSGLRMIEGVPGDESSLPSSINDHGEVVASSTPYGSGPHAVFWSDATGVVELGELPGIRNSHGSDINNHRQIVGYATGQGGSFAVIWDAEGQMHNVNDLLVRDGPDDQYPHLIGAREISDAGWVTASSLEGGGLRTFLLIPARRSPSGDYHCSCGK